MATNLKNYISKDVGTTPVTVYNPTSAGIQATVLSMFLVNTTSSNVTASVTYISGATTVYLIKDVTLLTNNSLDLLGGSKLIVEQNDSIQVVSSTSASVDVTISAVEVS